MAQYEITYYSLSDYNAGRLIPFTIELDDMTAEEHAEAIQEHLEAITERMADDEVREEWIVADYAGIPSRYVGEYSLDDDFFEYLEFTRQTHLGDDVIKAGMSLDIPLEHIEEAYKGHWENDEAFAMEEAEQMGMIPETHTWPTSYIDWERAARDLMMVFNEADGHYFSANW